MTSPSYDRKLDHLDYWIIGYWKVGIYPAYTTASHQWIHNNTIFCADTQKSPKYNTRSTDEDVFLVSLSGQKSAFIHWFFCLSPKQQKLFLWHPSVSPQDPTWMEHSVEASGLSLSWGGMQIVTMMRRKKLKPLKWDTSLNGKEAKETWWCSKWSSVWVAVPQNTGWFFRQSVELGFKPRITKLFRTPLDYWWRFHRGFLSFKHEFARLRLLHKDWNSFFIKEVAEVVLMKVGNRSRILHSIETMNVMFVLVHDWLQLFTGVYLEK